MEKLPEHLRIQAEELLCTAEGPRHVETINYAGAYAGLGVINTFSLEEFKKKFQIKIISNEPDHIVFDMIGIDVAYANAFRRIMIAEVATMAIETVYLYQNTGVIQDEVLCHRLGLIPFRVEPNLFKTRTENEALTDDNALLFKLHIVCDHKSLNPEMKAQPVYSRDLKWVPLSDRQRQKFEKDPPAPVNGEILITKLRPGQEIELECYVEKGIGKTHSKWSPSAPACYRLQPKIEFPNGPFTGKAAEELVEICPMKVFELRRDGKTAVVRDPRRCTTCRACIERFPDLVEIRKIKNHFIFSVEGTGAIPAVEIVRRAFAVFLEKVARIKASIAQFKEQDGGDRCVDT